MRSILGHCRIFPVCAYLDGKYSKKEIYLGVPVKPGKQGVEKVIELKLTDDEKEALDRSAEAVRSGIASLNALD